jgi:hypothetical protein
MLPVTLLLCGARAVIRAPEALWWAREHIDEAFDELPVGSLVVTGDAVGVDTETYERALARGLGVQRWTRHGAIVGPGWDRARWLPEGPAPVGYAAWRERLLARDRAMAAFVGSREGWRRALGLVVPWPLHDGERVTHGTDYTLDRCRAEGVSDVTRLLCPVEFGPAQVAA